MKRPKKPSKAHAAIKAGLEDAIAFAKGGPFKPARFQIIIDTPDADDRQWFWRATHMLGGQSVDGHGRAADLARALEQIRVYINRAVPFGPQPSLLREIIAHTSVQCQGCLGEGRHRLDCLSMQAKRLLEDMP